MVVVADSSPLIYLSRVGILDLLATVCGDVVVPQAVWDEVVQKRPTAPGVDTLRHASWIRVDDRRLPQVDLGLDAGETAAILLAEMIHADVLLIDERIGRKVAERVASRSAEPSVCSFKPTRRERCLRCGPFSRLW